MLSYRYVMHFLVRLTYVNIYWEYYTTCALPIERQHNLTGECATLTEIAYLSYRARTELKERREKMKRKQK